jgi:hypothetical protein
MWQNGTRNENGARGEEKKTTRHGTPRGKSSIILIAFGREKERERERENKNARAQRREKTKSKTGGKQKKKKMKKENNGIGFSFRCNRDNNYHRCPPPPAVLVRFARAYKSSAVYDMPRRQEPKNARVLSFRRPRVQG